MIDEPLVGLPDEPLVGLPDEPLVGLPDEPLVMTNKGLLSIYFL